MTQGLRRALLSPNNRLNVFLMKYPKQTSVGFTCVKTIAADLVVQTFVDGSSLNEIDYTRTAVFGSFGFLYLGMFQYWLYNIMYFKWFPGATLRSTIKKLNERKMDKTIFKSVVNRYKNNIWSDMKALWKVWIPASSIAFGIMPLHLRLPFMASVSFFWCCILSFMHGKYDKKELEEILVIKTKKMDL
eukprot:476980_1